MYAKTSPAVRFWKFLKMTAKHKVMEKVIESHEIWRTQKSTNPVQNGSTFKLLRQKNDQHEISPYNI